VLDDIGKIAGVEMMAIIHGQQLMQDSGE